MIRRIQHLRGTESEYRQHDIVVPDGELALIRRADGTTGVKIGDGVRPFSALPFLGRTVQEEGGDGAVMLTNETEHRLPIVNRVEILLPDELSEGFSAALSFTSPNGSTTFSYPATRILFIGDHTEGGIFVPEGRYHYLVSFHYNGEVVLGRVSAVSVDLITHLPREIREESGYGAISMSLGNGEDLLEVTVGGQSSHADVYGEVTGVGEMDTDTYRFILKVLLGNKTVCNFTTFAERFLNVYHSAVGVDVSYTAGRLTYITEATPSLGFLTRTNTPFADGRRYHIRLTVSKQGGTPLTIGSPFDTGILVHYTDGTSTAVAKPYTGRLNVIGCPTETVDFYTDPNKVIHRIGVHYTPESATNVLTPEEFLFVADDGTEDVPEPRCETLIFPIEEPLLSINEERDTVALRSGLLTRRVATLSGRNLTCEVYDRTGEITIYRYTLTKAARPYSPVVMTGFRNKNYAELKTSEKACCIDENGNYLYFTLTKTCQTLDDYWSFTDSRVPGPCYLLAEEVIEQLDAPDLIAHRGFCAISIPEHDEAAICATYLV